MIFMRKALLAAALAIGCVLVAVGAFVEWFLDKKPPDKKARLGYGETPMTDA
jgi:hypothetical protein